jgi:hypothetical protein
MEWISVKDKLPEAQVTGYSSNRVLVITTSGMYEVAYVMDGVWWRERATKPFEDFGYKISHWMPLPEPPKV